MAELGSRELLDFLLEDNILTPAQLDEFILENPEEDQYVDYKNGLITSRQQRERGIQTIRKYTSGFANSDGGVLIIGVSEDWPRQVATCEQRPGGQPLDQWASRCMHDMAAYFSPQPRFQVVEHPQGHIMAIAVARAPSLVPCIEARELKYFFRIGDSTIQAPEFLLTDLMSGRRQQPVLDLHTLSIDEDRSDLSSKDGRDRIPARSVRFSFIVENLSLITVEDIHVGIVSWSLDTQKRHLVGLA